LKKSLTQLGRLADRSFVVGTVAIQYHSAEEIFALVEGRTEPFTFIGLQARYP
jgi:hypothetical protein